MGLFGSVKPSEIVAHSSIPPYCVKSIGSRHFLVAGGGGGAKTGVRNEIDLFLLTYDNDLSFQQHSQPTKIKLMGRSTRVIDTSTFSNMNMDVIAVDSAESGRYIIATGQDQYCAIYEATGFSLCNPAEEIPSLSFDFQGVCRIKTDDNSKDPYQTCVKLFPRRNQLYAATGGADGRVRIWNVSWIISMKWISKIDTTVQEQGSSDDSEAICDGGNKIPLKDVKVKPEVEIETGSELVDDLDVSTCGTIVAVIRSKETSCYDTSTGAQLISLNNPAELGNGFKVRALRFLPLDKSDKNAIFIAAYNQRVRTSKEVSFLALWAFNKQEGSCHLISCKRACNETISCLAGSECGNFITIGTMAGSVAIFDTHNLSKPLHFSGQTHTSFVTSVDFLPQRSYDAKGWGRIQKQKAEVDARCFLPGVCSSSRASVISLSVDQTVQMHSVDYPTPATLTGFVLKMAVWSLAIYLLLWLLLVY